METSRYAAHEARNKDYAVPLEFDEDGESIFTWARETFPGTPHALKIAARANKEMSELLMVLAEWTVEVSTNGNSPRAQDLAEKIKEETVDVLIVVKQLPPLLGFSEQRKTNEKMKINRKRRWEKASDGSHQHVKE